LGGKLTFRQIRTGMTLDERPEDSEAQATMVSGGCRCGAVRYTISRGNLPPVYACHCLACQSGSGSAFSEQAVIPDGSIEASGPVLDYRFTRPDGNHGHHRLCAECFTRLWSTNNALPGVALVRAGTLDRSQELTPRAHMWIKRKQLWVEVPADVAQWPESPPEGELAKALASA
jgi:hypothetical protein